MKVIHYYITFLPFMFTFTLDSIARVLPTPAAAVEQTEYIFFKALSHGVNLSEYTTRRQGAVLYVLLGLPPYSSVKINTLNKSFRRSVRCIKCST